MKRKLVRNTIGVGLLCILSYGYGMYSLIHGTFPFDLVRSLKKSAADEEAGFLNPQAAVAAEVYRQFYRDADIVMLGDSITKSGNWSEMFPDHNIVNRGVGGDTALGILNRVDDVMLTTPDQVFVMVGINDIYGRTSVDAILQRYKQIIDAFAGQTQFFVQSTIECSGASCLPERLVAVRALNDGLRALTTERNLPFIDLNATLSDANGLRSEFTYDGIHLNLAGMVAWQAMLEPWLEPTRN